MTAKTGAFKFIGIENELECVRDIPDSGILNPGDELVLCFGEDPRKWDAIVVLIDFGNNGYWEVSVVRVNAKKGIRKPENNAKLQLEARKLFIPKSFLEQEEKK